jgi:hypothetical protein
MDAPSLVTYQERQTIAREIASKYHTFAAKVSVTFYKEKICVIVYPDEMLKLPSPESFTVFVEREE